MTVQMKTVLEDLTIYSRPGRRQEFLEGGVGGRRLALLVTNLTKRGAIAAGDLGSLGETRQS